MELSEMAFEWATDHPMAFTLLMLPIFTAVSVSTCIATWRIAIIGIGK